MTVKEEIYNVLLEYHRKSNTNLKFNPWVSEYLLLNIEKDDFLKRYAPHIEKMSLQGNILLLKDHKRNQYAEIEYKDNTVWCRLDESDSCIHVHYAFALPELARLKK